MKTEVRVRLDLIIESDGISFEAVAIGREGQVIAAGGRRPDPHAAYESAIQSMKMGYSESPVILTTLQKMRAITAITERSST